MAVLFTTLFSALGGGTAAGVGGVVAGGSAVGGGLTSALSIASTVVGGLASLASGASQKSALDQQAVDQETKAVQSTLEGRSASLDAMRRLNRDMASISVAGYASGIGAEGSVMAAQNEAQRIGDLNMNLARTDAAIMSAGRRSEARQSRAEGKAAQLGGVMGALQGGFSLFDRRDRRG